MGRLSDNRQHLTQNWIDAFPSPPVVTIIWDTRVPGFGVRVLPTGTKTYVFRYRTAAGRKRQKKIGRTTALSLDKARRLAKVDGGAVAEKQDPQRDTDTAKAGLTVAKVAAIWMADFILPRRAKKTARDYQFALDTYILPAIGTHPIAEVDAPDVVQLHDTLTKTPTMANRVIAALSSLITWSMHGSKKKGGRASGGRGRYRPVGPNPCFGLEKFGEAKRKRYLTTAEYARVGQALKKAKHLSPSIRLALELCLLSGARPGEIAGLLWSWVDLATGVILIPSKENSETGDTSKTGEKPIFLAPEALRRLKQWPRHVGSPYVFPGTGRHTRGLHLSPSTLTHAWEDLRATIDLEDVRLYDACRHSYASVAISDHDLTLPQLGKQLGHSQAATTDRYAHLHVKKQLKDAAHVGGTIASRLKLRRAR